MPLVYFANEGTFPMPMMLLTVRHCMLKVERGFLLLENEWHETKFLTVEIQASTVRTVFS